MNEGIKQENPIELIKVFYKFKKEVIQVFKDTTVSSHGIECYKDLNYYLYPKNECVALIEQIKSIDEYQILASRTLPDLTETDSELTLLDDKILNANDIHIIYGVYTELGEILDLYKKSFAYKKVFDKVNLMEEVCDIIWYLAGQATQDFVHLSRRFEIVYTGELIPKLDYPSVEEMRNMLREYEATTSSNTRILEFLGKCVASEQELFRGLTNNINKLIIRYFDKYSNERAVNRNLSEERKQLEQ